MILPLSPILGGLVRKALKGPPKCCYVSEEIGTGPSLEFRMSVVRTEYRGIGDLVFENSTASGELETVEKFSVSLRNDAPDEQGHVTGFIATVIGPASSLDEAIHEHAIQLAHALDYLSLVTRCRYRIGEPLRAIEWEPGPGRRKMLAFLRFDGRYPPLPRLSQRYFDGGRVILHDALEPFLLTAARYFRLALLDKSAADQFIKFWHALEVIAENTIERALTPITCRKCSSPISCAECGHEATRFPFPKDAIKEVLNRLKVPDLEDNFKHLLTARNSLMHGGNSKTVERKCGVPLTTLVNRLGSIVQAAIIVRAGSGNRLFFAHDGELCGFHQLNRLRLEFDYAGPGEHPEEELIPKPIISVTHSFEATDLTESASQEG